MKLIRVGTSFEVKARCHDPARVRAALRSLKAEFKGRDRQIDTYFHVPSGRLKLRQGNIENALIYYQRVNKKRSKRCDAVLFPCPDGGALKKILAAAFGILVVVDKRREIYFIRNVKFHIDRVKKLGPFVEIEVFGRKKDVVRLREQCELFQELLGILPEDLVADSYSDQLLQLSAARKLG